MFIIRWLIKWPSESEARFSYLVPHHSYPAEHTAWKPITEEAIRFDSREAAEAMVAQRGVGEVIEV